MKLTKAFFCERVEPRGGNYKDYQRLPAVSEAMIYSAMSRRLMLRRLAPPTA